MGMLVNGQWRDETPGKDDVKGRFERKDSVVRNWVTSDGSPGPGGDGGFKAEAGRYHLYVSLACPWAHRALIMRKLKGLENHLAVSVVHGLLGDDGWTFAEGDQSTGDRVNGADYLRELYTRADPDYTGKVTVPVLWDTTKNTIVSNESAEIIRMFNAAFDTVGAAAGDYYPKALRSEIDAINARVYETLNNGVYKAGFATEQSAYDEAVVPLFETLDWLEERLTTRRYLLGDRLTEADIRLFTTLVRFDSVYHGHFKCNIRRIVDYPNLWGFTRDVYQLPGIAETVDLEHIKFHYYGSHRGVNPSGIVPAGPELDLMASSGRENKGG